MEDVFKIAEKATAQAEKQAKGKNITASKLKPIDRVIMFLQQTKKMEQAEKERKRTEAIKEVVEEQKRKEAEERKLKRQQEEQKKLEQTL